MIKEVDGLKQEILGVKHHFDGERGSVLKFESTISFLKNECKKLKRISEESYLSLRKELELYRLDILKSEKAFTTYYDKLVPVQDQVIDLESRFIKSL